MKNIFWTGFSDDERHIAINKIQNTVSKYGDIVDFHLFSDISLSMAIEIEELKIENQELKDKLTLLEEKIKRIESILNLEL